MRTSAIIVAAGNGRRLGCSVPKAFVQIGEFPMLHYSLRTLTRLSEIVEVVIAIPEGMEAEARRAVSRSNLKIPVKLTPGGAERHDSVRTALSLTSAESDIVLVHDAARPYATADLFSVSIHKASQSGGAIVATPLADTLKEVAGGAIVRTRPRADYYLAQTPQAFRRDLLIAAHCAAREETSRHDNRTATDDAELVERIGGRVEVVEGLSSNFKITTSADLALARMLATSMLPG